MCVSAYFRRKISASTHKNDGERGIQRRATGTLTAEQALERVHHNEEAFRTTERKPQGPG